MYCSSCGTPHAPDAAFRGRCGSQLSPPAPAPVAASLSGASVMTETAYAPGPAHPPAYAPGPGHPPPYERGPSYTDGLHGLLAPAFVRRAASSLGIALAATYALSFAVTGVALLLLSAADRDTGEALPPWLRSSILQVAMALRAPLVVTQDSRGGATSFQVIVMPLLLTAVLAGLLAWLSARAERSVPSGTGALPVTVASAATGFTAATIVTILAWLAGGDVEARSARGTQTFGFFVSYWQPLLFGTVLLTLAVLAGRTSARRRTTPHEPWIGALQTAGGYVGATLRMVRDQLLLGSAAALALGWMYVGLFYDNSRTTSGYLLASVLFAPNIALAGLALTMGITLAGDTGGALNQADSTGLLTGELPATAYLILLVPIAATFLAGVREGLRSPATGWPARAWMLPLVSLAAWITVAFLIAVGIFADISVLGRSSETASVVGLSLRSLVVFSLLWGLALALAQGYATGLFAGMFPRTALMWGGRHTHPAWRSGIDAVLRGDAGAHGHGLVRDHRLAGRWLSIVLAVLLALALLAVGVTTVLARTVYGPGPTAEKVLAAVNDGDVEYLEAHANDWQPGGALLSAEALRATHQGNGELTAITALRTVPDSGDSRTVTVAYEVGGVRREADLEMTREDGTWRVNQLLGSLVFGDRERGHRVEGVDTVVTGAVAAPPGVYAVTADAAEGLTSAPATLEVRPGTPSRVILELEVSPDARQKILAELDAMIQRCAATNDPRPPSCPFQSFAYQPEDFSWRVNRKPSDTAVVEFNRFNGGIRVKGSVDLTATYKRTPLFGGKAEPVEENGTPSYNMRAVFDGGEVTLRTGF